MKAYVTFCEKNNAIIYHIHKTRYDSHERCLMIGNNIITYLRYTPVTAHNKRIYWMTTSTVVANRARDSAGKRTFHARALTRSAAFVAATIVADAFAAATHHVDRSLDS
ncbi:hypothetical protein QTP88_020218 [Uroleucon formosanum]